jgi:hypothetical protein
MYKLTRDLTKDFWAGTTIRPPITTPTVIYPKIGTSTEYHTITITTTTMYSRNYYTGGIFRK